MAAFSTILTGVLGAIGAAGSVLQSRAASRAADNQASANQQAKTAADAENRRQDREFNRLNARRPNVAALAARNAIAGASPTMLTGAQGAPIDDALLGRTTLLGG